MKVSPLVSIVVITYNSSFYVLETLESIRLQTYGNIELIISDDGSKDKTVEICKKWIEKHKHLFVNTKLIESEKNTGITVNCNRGAKACTGEWIKFIAADDALNPDCISNFMKYSEKNKDALFFFANVEQYFDDFSSHNLTSSNNCGKMKISKAEITAKEQYQILLRWNLLYAPAWIFSKEVFEKVGYFDESVRLWEDRPMLLKMTSNGIKLYFADFIACKYRLHSQSVQKSQKKEKLISECELEKNRHFIQHYLRDLSLTERLAYYVLLWRPIILDKLGLNRYNLFSRSLMKITSYPWIWIKRQKIKQYY